MHYQELGSARHQYGISALVTQTSFGKGSTGDLAKRWLFCQAIKYFHIYSRKQRKIRIELESENACIIYVWGCAEILPFSHVSG